MRLLPILAVLFVLTACDDGRWAPGYLITDEGETLSNTAENKRALAIHTIVKQLDQDVGAHWRTDVSIAELPRYERGADDDRSSAWMWPVATVAITMVGDGAAEPRITEAQVTKAVSDYLYHQVDRPQKNLHVTATRVIDAERFAAKPVKPTNASSAPTAEKPAETVVKPVVPASSAARRYVVQAGDTWADLSQAFYGSAQHWRHLADANQNAELTTGREIVIPPKP